MGWTLLATAPNELTAQVWVELLRDQGIAAVIAPSDTMSYLGMSPRPCRVLVATSQLEPAQQLLSTFVPAATAHGDETESQSASNEG